MNTMSFEHNSFVMLSNYSNVLVMSDSITFVS